ncbi:UNVERIFIED_CONTAM: hypothetical protein RMT77_009658 [Armadillidium vulgare]
MLNPSLPSYDENILNIDFKKLLVISSKKKKKKSVEVLKFSVYFKKKDSMRRLRSFDLVENINLALFQAIACCSMMCKNIVLLWFLLLTTTLCWSTVSVMFWWSHQYMICYKFIDVQHHRYKKIGEVYDVPRNTCDIIYWRDHRNITGMHR